MRQTLSSAAAAAVASCRGVRFGDYGQGANAAKAAAGTLCVQAGGSFIEPSSVIASTRASTCSRRQQQAASKCEGHGPSSVSMRWITLGDNIA
eukprot:363711-Chlamydomonas_euryale.AAC.6